jgi:rare lipoprotein A
VRPQHLLRAVPAAGLVGALGIAMSPAVAAPATTAVTPKATTGEPIQAAVADHTLRYGQRVSVVGRLRSGQPAVAVRLEFRAAGTATWAALRSAQSTTGGRFALRASVHRSGTVRVVQPADQPTAQAAATGAEALDIVASAERAVRVGARIVPAAVSRNVRAGRVVRVSGAVRPARAGRTVSLQLRRAGRWHTVDRAHTRAAGGFHLRERMRSAASLRARLRFRGDGVNAATARSLGRVNAYRTAVASWYGPGLYGQPLGCGGTLSTATIGVAHKTLPCGTMLTLRYRGRTVRAPVVDRGPYVGGRELDLTAATRARLRFGSTGIVQVAG